MPPPVGEASNAHHRGRRRTQVRLRGEQRQSSQLELCRRLARQRHQLMAVPPAQLVDRVEDCKAGPSGQEAVGHTAQ